MKSAYINGIKIMKEYLENKEKTKVFDSNQVKSILDGSISVFREPIDLPNTVEDVQLVSYADGIYMSYEVGFLWDMDHNKHPEYQPGDLVHVLEEWHFIDEPGVIEAGIIFKNGGCVEISSIWEFSDDWPDFVEELWDKQCEGWQPAETMPVEFSRIKLKITGVEVQKLGDMTEEDYIEYGIKQPRNALEAEQWDYYPMFKNNWNKLHPDHPYSEDLHTFMYAFKLLKEEEK